MRETKQPPHVIVKHGQSLLTGETVTFVENASAPSSLVVSGSITSRNALIRRMLGWKTMYPATDQCEGLR